MKSRFNLFYCKSNLLQFIVVLLLLLSITILGCGGDDDEDPTPNFTVFTAGGTYSIVPSIEPMLQSAVSH